MTNDKLTENFDNIRAVWCSKCKLWYGPMDGCLEHEDTINVGLIPIQELEELEKEWNEAAESIKTDETIDAPGYRRALSKANSELREVIGKYE